MRATTKTRLICLFNTIYDKIWQPPQVQRIGSDNQLVRIGIRNELWIFFILFFSNNNTLWGFIMIRKNNLQELTQW